MSKNLKTFQKSILVLILLSLIMFSVSCGFIVAQTPSSPPPTAIPTVSGPALANGTPPPPTSGSPITGNWTPPTLSQTALPADLSDIAARVLPSVVSINVQVTGTNIFGRPTTQQGAGSGWIIDASGLIVTNSHVIEGAQNISVSLHDGRVFPAQQITADAISDLAVIKINASNLPVATLGDSNKLKQGMMVIAIGNSLGQGISVTAGWVSRLEVPLSAPATATEPSAMLFDLIETSAPINPGNSGGPLVDMLGEVVGITNAKLVATGIDAVGYAISTKTAMPILQQLVQTGRVIRPYLGVSMADVDPTIASIYGLGVKEGALVTQVDTNGPAGRAGIQAGDVIVNINNTNITSASDAVQAILNGKVGQQVTVAYYRGNTRSSAQVTLAQNPNS